MLHDFRTSIPSKENTLIILTLIGLDCLDMFRLGGGGGRMPPPLSSLFEDLSQQNFVRGLTIKALAQIWKEIWIKINDVIDNGVIIMKKLAEKILKRVYFKIAAASSCFIQSY